MNKNVEPNHASVTASTWFAEYLQHKVLDHREATKLADAIGIERKSIYAYAYLQRSPKLDIVAKVLAYYGENFIRIPLITLENLES